MNKWKGVSGRYRNFTIDFRDVESWKEHCWKLMSFLKPIRELTLQDKRSTGSLESDRHPQGETGTWHSFIQDRQAE